MKAFQSIVRILHAHRYMYILALLAISLGTFFAYSGPLVIKTAIDSLLNGQPLDGSLFVDRIFIRLGGIEYLKDRLYIPALVLVVIVAGQGLFTFVAKLLAARAAEGSIKRLRDRLFRHIQRQPYSFFSGASTGDVIQRCTSDVDTIRRFLETQLIEIGNTLVMLAIALGLMFTIHKPLAWLTMPIIPLTLFFSYFFFRNVQRVFTLSDESEGRLSAMLSEHLTGIRVVKAFGRERYEIDRFELLNQDYRKTTGKLIDLLAMYWGTTSMFSMGQVVLVLSMGSIWAVNGTVTLGILQVFISYVWMILWPLRQMGRILVDMGKAFVSVGRINEILDSDQEDVHTSGGTGRITGKIRFEDVCFAYPRDANPVKFPAAAAAAADDGDGDGDGERGQEAVAGQMKSQQEDVLRGVSFDIMPGETIGILGPTGSGKTTILHLLAGLYDGYRGNIFLDDTELRDMNLQAYRKQLGYVLQEPFLFSGSIKKNIKMGRGTALMDDIRRVASEAEVHHVISSFEQNYHTVIGERGVTLSGGQKQRVAIARAMIKDVPLYMFDDSLSALDAETDAKIRNTLISRKNLATTLIVSHRLSTIAGADRIMVLEHGRISQMGTHRQLSRREGLYRRLWELQKRGSEGDILVGAE
ncbi:ABC transporter ATP-binding protein [Salinispira pacifica]|uniref:ABC transporter, ATP-binding/permease protein n=1 Tax=Salinispira pacifica TaxID=1307761 RepID=V5WKA1_9SPIO|nr:ABC transporter ATP-binding protein [Salinispira pacifica]AHC15611.1 ABC transporter, ATP-binding/permease protein [Salinispira pacifica]